MLLRYQGILMSGSYSHELLVTSFDPPTTSIRGESSVRYARDGTMSPREWLGESHWTWTVTTNVQSLFEAMKLASRVESAWRDPEIRDSTSHVPLEYSNDGGGTWYRVYGRPGRFTSFAPNIRAVHGVGSMELEFVQRDPNHYSNAEHQVTITAAPASVAGLVSPLISPLTTVPMGAPRAGLLVNHGDRPAPASVRFNGPCENPRITTQTSSVVGYRGALAAHQYVVIDGVNQTVLLNGSQPVPGRLTLDTRLSTLKVPTGETLWTYQSTDPTGTASARVSHRDAYASMQY